MAAPLTPTEKAVKTVANVAIKVAAASVGIGIRGDIVGAFEDPGHRGWDPVVPHDLHLAKLPPIAADGTGECWRCKQRFAFAQLDIANQAYVCRPCALRAAQVAAQLQSASVDLDNVSLRSKKWLMWPAAALVTIGFFAVIYLYH